MSLRLEKQHFHQRATSTIVAERTPATIPNIFLEEMVPDSGRTKRKKKKKKVSGQAKSTAKFLVNLREETYDRYSRNFINHTN